MKLSKERDNKYKKLIKNILLLFTGNFVSKILSFLMVPFYTSMLSTSDYGISDLISTTVLLVLPFFSVLMDEAVMRFTLEETNDNKQVFTIAFFISTIGFIVALAISPIILLFSNLKKYYLYIILYYIVSWIYNIVFSYVKGMNKVALTTIAGIIHTFSFLGLNILFLAVLKIGITGYLLAISLSNGISIIYLVLKCKLYKNFISIKSLDYKMAKKMIRYSLPLIPDYISWWFNNASDRYILAFFSTTSAVGIYSVAYKIPSILSSLTSIFSSAWKISSVDDFGSEQSIKFYNSIYKTYISTLFICASFLIMFTRILARLLFSKGFYKAWEITPILIFAFIYSALAQYIASIFNASKKTNKVFFASTLGAIINILLNFLLIPFFSGIGAAIATTAGYITILVINMINTQKILKIDLNLKNIITQSILLIIEIVGIMLNIKMGSIISLICLMFILIYNKENLILLYKTGVSKVLKKGEKL